MLRKDKEEVEAIKHAKALEAEKAMYSVGPPPPLCRAEHFCISQTLPDCSRYPRVGGRW